MSKPWEKYQNNSSESNNNAPWLKYQANAPQKKPEPSIGRTILDQGLQGATFGLADEVSDGLGAVIAKGGDMINDAFTGNGVLTNKSLGDVYDDARTLTSARLQNQMEQRPVLSLAANIVPAIATANMASPFIATTKLGKVNAALQTTKAPAITGAVARGAVEVAKRAIPAGAAGVAYGFNAGEGGFENRIENAKDLGLLSAGLGVAAPTVINTVKGAGGAVKGAFARNIDDLAEANTAMKTNTASAYNQVAQVPILQSGINKINTALDDAFKDMVDVKASAKDINTLKKIKKDFGKMYATPHSPNKVSTTIKTIEDAKSAIYNLGNDFVTGSNERRIYKKFGGVLDDMLMNKLKPDDFATSSKSDLMALQAGRQLHKQQKKFEVVSKIVEKSTLSPNPEKYIQQELKKLLLGTTQKKANQLAFFDTAEKTALKKAANTSGGQALLQQLGRFGFSRNINPISMNGVRLATGIVAPHTAIPLAAATGAKYASKGITANKVEGLLKTIEKSAKPYQGVDDAIEGVSGVAPSINPTRYNSPSTGLQTVNQPNMAATLDDTAQALSTEAPINVRQPQSFLNAPQAMLPSANRAAQPAVANETIALPDQSQHSLPQAASKTIKAPRQPKIDIAQKSKDENLSALDDAYFSQLPDDMKNYAQDFLAKREQAKTELLTFVQSKLKKDINPKEAQKYLKKVESDIDALYNGKVSNSGSLDKLYQKLNWKLTGEKTGDGVSIATNDDEAIKAFSGVFEGALSNTSKMKFSKKPILFEMTRPDGTKSTYKLDASLANFIKIREKFRKLPKDRFVAITAGGAGIGAASQAEANFNPQSYNTQFSAQPNFTQQKEGRELTAYTDTTGNRTIADGFNFNSGIAQKVWKQAGLPAQLYNKAKRGEVQLTPYDADMLFQVSYDVADKDARAFYPDFEKLSQSQQEGLRDLAYQVGLPSLKQFTGLKKALQNGDLNAIMKHSINSKVHTQTPERNLARAKLLMRLE